MRVNLRDIRLSELNQAIADAPDNSVSAALQFLARRAVLLQEADRSGLGKGLPEAPTARARAFLERVISERVLCGNITERELKQMYRAMLPRFVHGDIYRVAELRWHCDDADDPETASCRDAAQHWAAEHWLPIVDAIGTSDDLYWLGMDSATPVPLRYVEFTFHVDEKGRSSVPDAVALAVKELSTGDAHVLVSQTGARVQVLLEHRPPAHRPLTDPDVRAEVTAELCPRLVERNRSSYVETLLSAAAVDIKRELLPAGHDVPAEAMAP